MIDLSDIDEAEPFQLFKEAYNKAEKHDQLNIDAASISSFNKNLNEVSARYVNLKFFKGEKIFFFQIIILGKIKILIPMIKLH